MTVIQGASMTAYDIRLHWDADAHVWWAESNDVPGLVAEAETLEVIMQDVVTVVPALLRLNAGEREETVTLNFLADRSEALHLA